MLSLPHSSQTSEVESKQNAEADNEVRELEFEPAPSEKLPPWMQRLVNSPGLATAVFEDGES
jgi:hypothetical protein